MAFITACLVKRIEMHDGAIINVIQTLIMKPVKFGGNCNMCYIRLYMNNNLATL
jgi:hypothetical protein